MGLAEAGQMGQALAGGDDPRLRQVAEILQRVRPDIILLNEFDYEKSTPAASQFNRNYLAKSQGGQQPIEYPYSFHAPVNTGLDSGLDLDGDGVLGEPDDAFGYGAFPGQYGMLVLSRYPLRPQKARSFQFFKWSALPGAQRPLNPNGSSYYEDDIWQQLRLSSKSHWDLPFNIEDRTLHLLAYHPTPPVFDGPEDRNGKRNFDEHRFWLEYLHAGPDGVITDDEGNPGGLEPGATFFIAGDFNADPLDGDSIKGAVGQLLDSPLIDSSCIPTSAGAAEASATQGGINLEHHGDPAADTSDFNDERTGNLRLDYLLPSKGLTIEGCGVFWPASTEKGASIVDVSDHRLVWLDIVL
jgi:endonuclease/exonuclease/phosphatase family metal-dependent hydrolase